MQNTIQKQDLTSPFAKTNAKIEEPYVEESIESNYLDHLDTVEDFEPKDEDEFEEPEFNPSSTDVKEEEKLDPDV